MELTELTFPVLAVLTGLLLGALGSGGSILALPALVYAAGLPVKAAVATSLAVIGATSLIGAVTARRRCAVYGCPGQEADGGVAVRFALGGLVGSLVGARFLSGLLPSAVQMILFAIVMLGAAGAMLLRRPKHTADAESTAMTAPPRRSPVLVPVLGFGVGLLTGLVGVGGGFLIVPALTLLAGLPVKRAASTSLWIIAANSATALIGYLGRVPVMWGVAGTFLALALLGMAAGQVIARRLPPERLQTAFAVFLVIVALYTLGNAPGK